MLHQSRLVSVCEGSDGREMTTSVVNLLLITLVKPGNFFPGNVVKEIDLPITYSRYIFHWSVCCISTASKGSMKTAQRAGGHIYKTLFSYISIMSNL